MLDFTPVRKKQRTLADLAAPLTSADLRRLTNEMIDAQLTLLEGCIDADVTFAPEDPEAHDAAAANGEVGRAWTLGHVIVHATASSEEAAFIAAELARGVPHREGRSRSEVHWTTITTIAQCRARLEESRRMRLASLDLWPDVPHLDNTWMYSSVTSSRTGMAINPLIHFLFGLNHDDSHLGQIQEIVRQAKAAREPGRG